MNMEATTSFEDLAHQDFPANASAWDAISAADHSQQPPLAQAGPGEPITGPRGLSAAGRNTMPRVFELPSFSKTITTVYDSYTEQEKTESWSHTAEIIKTYSDDMVAKWNAEIDTLLVYAGLFSAILTAFNVQSYQLLQPQSQDPTLAILEHLSSQLGSFSVENKFINSTQTPYVVSAANASSTSGPTRSAVWLNVLWFSGLICSLASASIGIMVKQWLREFSVGLSGTSEHVARLRQYRLNNLLKWHVGAIVSCLPVLLQTSLALFLSGLLVLLWTLNVTVASVASALIGCLFVFMTVTTVLPGIRTDCCYLTPISYAIYPFVQSSRRAVEVAAFMTVDLIRELYGYWKTELPSTLVVWYTRLAESRKIPRYNRWAIQEASNVSGLGMLYGDQIAAAYSATLEGRYLAGSGKVCLASIDRYARDDIIAAFDGIYAVNKKLDPALVGAKTCTHGVSVWLCLLLHVCFQLEDAHQDVEFGVTELAGCMRTHPVADLERMKKILLGYISRDLEHSTDGIEGWDAARMLMMLTPAIPLLLDDFHGIPRNDPKVVVATVRKLAKHVLGSWKMASHAVSAAEELLKSLDDAHKDLLDRSSEERIVLLHILLDCAEVPDAPLHAATSLRSVALSKVAETVHVLHTLHTSGLSADAPFDYERLCNIPRLVEGLHSVESRCRPSDARGFSSGFATPTVY